MIQRKCGDDIRGVGQHHTRVVVTCDRELDRLHQEEGTAAPWMDNQPEFVPDQFLAVWEFLHSLRVIGDRKRRIFFARLENLSWVQIGTALFKGATAQAAENEFAEIMRDHPALARAFPERKNQKKEHANG